MATYAIGDLHGNLDALQRLLDQLQFRAQHDELWFVGDVVNRGADSLGCLRFIRNLGNAAVTILGNHDLALLVHAQHPEATSQVNASLAPVLEASDGAQLLDWLRHRPLLHSDKTLGWTMVHAGLPAEWSISAAHAHAEELGRALRGPSHPQVLEQLYGNKPDTWRESLTGHARLRYITNALTRQRFVYPDGRLDLTHKTTLDQAPKPLVPWFRLPYRRNAGQRTVFGHWSALEPVAWPRHNVWCIDTGAAWGGHLTALRLDTEPEIISVPG